MKTGMKAIISMILLAWATGSHASTPKVNIEYNPTFDSICSFIKGGSIKDEWKEELIRRVPELEALWGQVGSSLISAAENITGGTFPEGEQTVRLTLCEIPSQSYLGIGVNMRYALSSFTGEPVTLRYKVDTIFHELLHKFMAKHQPKDSPLLKAHANEPDRTRNHLHLLALQKAALLKVNASAELADVVRFDSKLPGGYYKRAWEIINVTDNEYLKFIAEISKK